MKLILLSLIFISSTAFAQSTPDWRPINRVYKDDAHVVGSVGSAGQIKAGHVLTAKSFPLAIQTDSTKLAYWNLSADFNDELGVSAHNWINGTTAAGCNAGGNVALTTADIFGASNSSAYFNGSSNLCSTDPFFKPSATDDYYIGAWFKTNWVSAAGGTNLFANRYTGGADEGIRAYIGGNTIVIVDAVSATVTASFSYTTTFANDEWHHVAQRRVGTTLSLLVDGTVVGSTTMSARFAPNGTLFRFGAQYSTANAFYTGSISNPIFIKGYAVNDVDCRKFASTEIKHNKNLIAKRQDWQIRHQHKGVSGNPYQKLPFVWMDPTDSNSLFLDLADLDSDDKLDIRLYDIQQ